jgi:pimeloyl-ACP methyl ester carboxylesterase
VTEIQHRTIKTNGIKMHIAEAGEGPLVVLCHGFPESWYSWRHQLTALADAGYHAVAPDQRGYGGTDKPENIGDYTIMHLVGDIVGLLDALDEPTAAIVGHDWGSIVAWDAALLRPDRFPAVVGMSVPYLPRTPISPLSMMKAMAGDRFMYVLYFQEPGKAEAELEPRIEEFMRGMLYTASGSLPDDVEFDFDLPKTAGFMDAMKQPEKLPDWLTEEDVAFYVGEFQRNGLRGPLNWYRNFERNWELLAPWAGAKVEVPALFVGGLKDGVVTGPERKGEGPMVAMLPTVLGDLRGKVLIEGAGHWNQQEAPAETNRALLEFFESLELRAKRA